MTSDYVDATVFLDRAIAAVCKAVGERKEGQVGFVIAVVTVGCNILARLTSHERAEEHHLTRAAYHRSRVAKHRMGGSRR
jgi:hypothetical protein